MPELWDAYLADGRKAGLTLARGEEIPAGLYHLFTDVLVKHTDGDYLVMQRDYRKEGYPGKFEAGGGGAVLAGETPYDGALRELKEETGIAAGSLLECQKSSLCGHAASLFKKPEMLGSKGGKGLSLLVCK